MDEQQVANNKAQIEKARNDANNADAVRNLANVAQSSGNGYAMAAGKAINAADKFSNGKSTELMGKAMTRMNKGSGLKGRLMQALSNKASEKGLGNKAAAMSRNNNTLSSNKQKMKQPKSTSNLASGDSKTLQKTVDESSNGGDGSVRMTTNALKTALLFVLPVIGIIFIFATLFTAASQVFLNCFTLGEADSVTMTGADEKIGNVDKNTYDKEISDEDVSYNFETNSDKVILMFDDGTSYESTLNFNNEMKKSKLIRIADEKEGIKDKWRENNEADLEDLEDFYSGIVGYSNKYDMNTVYSFFFKLYDLYHYYRDNYNLYLDMPLLMSTLRIQNEDISVVFGMNSNGYNRSNKGDFDINKDWTGYVSTKNDSSHDVEILAQNMISIVKTKESCTDSSGTVTKTNTILVDDETPKHMTCAEGETFKSEDILGVNENAYKEFLKEFLEKKYYSKEGYKAKAPNYDVKKTDYKEPDTTKTDSFAKEMIKVALNEVNDSSNTNPGLKYSLAYGLGHKDHWCATFVWYVSANTKYNGKSLYPDIITFRDAGVGPLTRGFLYSENENVNFYYNDSCKKYAGKNNKIKKYQPKPGDYIFFDWDQEFTHPDDDTLKDHVGIVEKYEDGIIYTIEGNYNDDFARVSYSANDCSVIGFGSWY